MSSRPSVASWLFASAASLAACFVGCGSSPTSDGAQSTDESIVVKPPVTPCILCELPVKPPACGEIDEVPCAGNECVAGRYDSLMNVCDYCGTTGEGCCNKGNVAGVQDCFDPNTICSTFGDSGRCIECGGPGQQVCADGRARPP